MRLAISVVVTALFMGLTASGVGSQEAPAEHGSWDREVAAKFLDERMDAWFANAKRLRTGQGETTCVSCHTMHGKDPVDQPLDLLGPHERGFEILLFGVGEKFGVLFGPNRVSRKNPFIEVSRRDRHRVEVCRTTHLQRVEAIGPDKKIAEVGTLVVHIARITAATDDR